MKQTLIAIVLLGLMAAVDVTTTVAYAQTQTKENRDDRQDNRQDAREGKHDCKDEDGKSNSDCRQDKRDDKRGGDEQEEVESK